MTRFATGRFSSGFPRAAGVIRMISQERRYFFAPRRAIMFSAMFWSLMVAGWLGELTIASRKRRIRMGVQAKMVIVKYEAAQESKPEPRLTRKVMAYNDKLFLAEHQMVQGWAGRVHSHLHDQIVYVVRGHLKVTRQG